MTMVDRPLAPVGIAPPSHWDRWLDRVERGYGAKIMGTKTGAEDLDWAYQCYLRNARPEDVVTALRARPAPLSAWERWAVLIVQAAVVAFAIGAMCALVVFFA